LPGGDEFPHVPAVDLYSKANGGYPERSSALFGFGGLTPTSGPEYYHFAMRAIGSEACSQDMCSPRNDSILGRSRIFLTKSPLSTGHEENQETGPEVTGLRERCTPREKKGAQAPGGRYPAKLLSDLLVKPAGSDCPLDCILLLSREVRPVAGVPSTPHEPGNIRGPR